jgi:hypothetical protein
MGYSFMILLRGQSSRKCSDPRDKVYSILSMTHASISKALPPDYSKSAIWTHVEAVRTYINISKKLDIFGCTTRKPRQNYPSWCPDWNKTKDCQMLAVNPGVDPAGNAVNNTSGITEAVATFSEDGSTIYLNGFCICTVVDNCFQDSDERIGSQKFAGVQSNWDIKHMALKLQHVNDTSASEDASEFSVYESEPETCFNTLATTILAGFWYGNYHLSVPPVKEDKKTGEWWPEGNKAQFLYEATERTRYRTVVLCDDGKLGLAPEKTESGDKVWVFMGASTPFVLRKLDGSDGGRNLYQFVGCAYIHGVMKGEAMEDLEKGKYEAQYVGLR